MNRQLWEGALRSLALLRGNPEAFGKISRTYWDRRPGPAEVWARLLLQFLHLQTVALPASCLWASTRSVTTVATIITPPPQMVGNARIDAGMV
jgi:hypothetical protein